MSILQGNSPDQARGCGIKSHVSVYQRIGHSKASHNIAIVTYFPYLLDLRIFIIDIISHPRITSRQSVGILMHSVGNRSQVFGKPRFILYRCRAVNPPFRYAYMIIIDFDNTISGGLAIRERRTAQNSRNAIIIQYGIFMKMSANFELYAYPFKLPGDVEVIEHSGILRIMIYKYSLDSRFETLQPDNAFFWYQCRSHSHVRAAIAAYEPPATILEFKMLIAENIAESIATTLRPFRIVVSSHYIIFQF